MSEMNYKSKYQQLKMQFMHSVDTAFRLGYEQGVQAAQLDQMNQQQQQQNAMQAQESQMGQEPGQEQAPEEVNAEAPVSEHPDGSELDQHIAKLDALINKPEAKSEDMAKALNDIKTFRKSQIEQIQLKKSTQAIKAISKALHKPAFKMSVQAAHNMNDNAKKAVTMQHKIVNDIMEKWEKEEMKVVKDISQVINVEGIVKGE